MEVESPSQFFRDVLPTRFKPEKAKNIDIIAQLNVSGPQGGNWTITIRNQTLEVKEGVDPAATLILKMSEKDLMDIINKKLSAEKAFFTGRIQFKGNITNALKLRDAGFL